MSDQNNVTGLDEYQKLCGFTDVYPNTKEGLLIVALGLCGEVGELADKIKKVMRDNDGNFTDFDVLNSIMLEIGDINWYLNRIAARLGYNMSDVASSNVLKIMDRRARGVTKGSGDHR